MSNLVIALVAIAFSALLMTAGISYLNQTHSVINTEASGAVNDVQQMMADYQTLNIDTNKVGSASRPTISDYQTVFAPAAGAAAAGVVAQSQNVSYRQDATGAIYRASSLHAPVNWVFDRGCTSMKTAHPPMDCFVMKVDESKLDPDAAKLTCDAVMLAQKRLTTDRSTAASQLVIADSTGKPTTCTP